MSFYAKCMRNGSLILFWMAIIAGIGSAATVLLNVSDMVISGVDDVYQPHGLRAFFQIFMALVSGISSATWPFIGAALLWLLDKRLPEQEAAE
jgi:hypothetical protein